MFKQISQVFKARKARKGFSLPEILVACAIIIALSSAAFFGFNQAQHTRKMAQMNSDMEALATACLTYEALSLNSTAPADLSALITGLSADESIDGVAHQNLVTTTKNGDSTTGSASTVTDPWGNEYEVDGGERTVTCTPKDPNGTDMSVVTRRF